MLKNGEFDLEADLQIWSVVGLSECAFWKWPQYVTPAQRSHGSYLKYHNCLFGLQNLLAIGYGGVSICLSHGFTCFLKAYIQSVLKITYLGV